MNRIIKIGFIGIGLAFITLTGFFDNYTSSVVAAEEKENATQTKSELPTAPEFTLKNLDGKDVKLSDYKGKVVMLNFWATWCPPCRLEIPDLIDLQKTYNKKGFTVIGVSFDQGKVEDIKSFYKKNKMNYPVLISNEDLAIDYGRIRGLPTTFLINQDGKVIKSYLGYMDKKVYEEDIKGLLDPTKKDK